MEEQEPIVLITEVPAKVQAEVPTISVHLVRITNLVPAVPADQELTILLQEADLVVVAVAQEVAAQEAVAQGPEAPVHLQEVVHAK